MDFSATYSWLLPTSSIPPKKIESSSSAWKTVRDKNGKIYWWNTSTNQTSWEKPVENEKRAMLQDPLSLFWGYTHDDKDNNHVTLIENSNSINIEAIPVGDDIIGIDEFKDVTRTDDGVKIIKPTEGNILITIEKFIITIIII